MLLYLKLDLAENSESRKFALDNANNLDAGDTIILSPEPVILQSNPSGGTPLTLTFAGVIDGQVQVRITGGSPNTLYSLSCRAPTTLGDILVASGELQTIGSV